MPDRTLALFIEPAEVTETEALEEFGAVLARDLVQREEIAAVEAVVEVTHRAETDGGQ